MTPQQIEDAAAALRSAQNTGEYIAPLRQSYAGLDIENAYAIQLHNTSRRLAEGRRLVGQKIGLTSLAVQRQLGVDQPDFGMLFDDMAYGDSEPIPTAGLCQPRLEAEIAFVLGRDLSMPRPGVLDAIKAIDYALPALEIVGSRIANWDIGIVDTIADNASSSAFVLGARPRKLAQFDLRLCGMRLDCRGKTISSGAGAACLGHPLNAVLWLARKMASLGTPLLAGDLVLSGALGAMVPVRPGDVFEADINGLGSVRAVFERDSGNHT
jgi:2-keto-4-pentenoate hydratase